MGLSVTLGGRARGGGGRKSGGEVALVTRTKVSGKTKGAQKRRRPGALGIGVQKSARTSSAKKRPHSSEPRRDGHMS